ncbi:glycosyltransferase [Anoxynatronum buryatiense]|uniref:1,2-diacylglycerol 3-alpha-glucosyltransferase n=1 Tax=Anoxynatronum buryatiense TaxID=489973 RepID=A0AA45WWG4_9CLOT|nr:glycosyltransferase [Anoxynatronum buryatiense]SMP57847.1 1,2-diacylglycerol 3-alpha-glucosyltransferase [Anoxynatronum buryatiense]
MKIALLTETWHPYTNGVTTHIAVLAEGLRSLGHEVLIVTADPDLRRHQVDAQGVLRCPGIAIKRIYGYGLAAPFSWKRYRILRNFGPDVIHIHQEFGVGTFGMLASRLLKVPLVYTLHTAYDEYLHYLAPPALIPVVRFISRAHVKLLATAAAMTTGPSEKASAYLNARGVVTPFVLVPNSVNLSLFHPGNRTNCFRGSLRRQMGIEDNHTLAIFVGRLGKEKSIAELLEYWQQMANGGNHFHLLIVGDGPDRETLEAIASKKHLPVTFVGKVPHETMPRYYGIADLFVSASTTEMMSIALLEAQASGLPVLQRFDPWNRQQVTDGVNGFAYEDAASLGRHLDYFHHLTERQWHEWRLRCRAHVAQQDHTHLAERLLEVYQQAIACSTVCPPGALAPTDTD